MELSADWQATHKALSLARLRLICSADNAVVMRLLVHRKLALRFPALYQPQGQDSQAHDATPHLPEPADVALQEIKTLRYSKAKLFGFAGSLLPGKQGSQWWSRHTQHCG